MYFCHRFVFYNIDEIKMSKEHKSAAEIRKLIALVKKKNCIWNREEHLYNKRNSLTKAWHDIAKNMHPSFDKMSTAEKNYAGKNNYKYLPTASSFVSWINE